MGIWFEVSLISGIIKKVEVEKYTDKSVWVKHGFKYVHRFPHVTHYTEFHPTFNEAHKSARRYLLDRIAEAEETFNTATKRLSRLDETNEESLDDPPKYDTPLLETRV